MVASTLPTDYAPAERADAALLELQADYFSELKLVRELFDAVPDAFLVLNPQRQIVFANKALTKIINVADESSIHGLRPGEVLSCVHAQENEGGCGTSEVCKTCGAVNAIMSSLRGKESVLECRITQRSGCSLDLRVWATPLRQNGSIYSLFAVQDISHEKRRRALERIFFHDIMNTAGGLQGVSELLQDATPEELDELKGMVYTLADRLVDEIQAQRLLSAAETDDLQVKPVPIESLAFLREVTNPYRSHEVAHNRQLKIDINAESLDLVSDRVLLGRVVGNMVKNALEACTPGATVTVGCRKLADDGVEFWVHNPTFVPRHVQLQVFQRSFSTKGAGRGLGTYSIKLLTERYLHGQAAFTTSPEAGTTFFVRFPRHGF